MYLPSPPNATEKYAYVHQNKLILYGLGVFSFVFLVTGMVVFTIQRPIFWFFAPFVILIIFYLLISYFIGIFSKEFDLKGHLDILEKGKEYFPAVDIFLPNCGEDIEILRNAYTAACNLNWPRLKVYVLDDRGRPEVEKLAGDLGATYLSRPDKGVLKKAGNLRYAFARSSGELILILDADFTPRPDMLREIVPYFLDSRIAIIQSPQFFELHPTQNWLQKGAAYIQELFYRLIQVSRNYWGAAICVGTCAVYRRSALEPFGGTAPIEHSEDVHTGFAVLEAGWQLKYIPINLAKGVCPDVLSAFFTQQYRWCTGSITLFSSKRFWQAKLHPLTRLCYMSGMIYYIATGFGIFMTPIPMFVVLWWFPEYVKWFNLAFSIPSFLFGTFYIGLWSKAPFGEYSLVTRLISYWAHAFALLDKVFKTTMPWVPTGGSGTSKSQQKFKTFMRCYLIWNNFVCFGTLIGVAMRMNGIMDYHYWPPVFFTLFNYYIAMLILKPCK